MAASMELNVQKWSVNIEEKIQDRVLGIFNILRLSLKEGTNLGTWDRVETWDHHDTESTTIAFQEE